MTGVWSMAVLLALIAGASRPRPVPADGQPGPAVTAAATLEEEVAGMAAIPAVTGREADAAVYIRGRLAGLPVEMDALGDVVVRLGKGQPRRLFACQLDEPGLVVSAIAPNGYLRLRPVGSIPGTLWTQFLEGQKVVVGSGDSALIGAVGVRSIHLNGRRSDDPPFGPHDAYVDVGADDAAGVAKLGVRMLDPVAGVRRVVELAGGRIAAPSVATKAACIAMADAARRVASGDPAGTVVFAWTVQGRYGRKGLAWVARAGGPFARVIVADDGFGAAEDSSVGGPGSGAIGAGVLDTALLGLSPAPHATPRGDVDWGPARVAYAGLPVRYAGSPVETIALSDVAALADAFVAAAGVSRQTRVAAPAPPPLPRLALLVRGGGSAEGARNRSGLGADDLDGSGTKEATSILAALVGRYGVSGDEGSVRDAVRALLPSWAKPRVDSAGNLTVDFGSGAEHEVYVAHMDEVGFVVDSIRADGTLVLGRRGGLYPSLWEGQAALVHVDGRDIPGIFQLREGWRRADHREPHDALTASVGAGSAEEARQMGVRVGATVTMPKRMLLLGPDRVVARGLDDRAGSTALLLAARHLDPSTVHRRLTFAWVVREEVGLLGSAALATRDAMHDVSRAYAIDTFVSSDAPLESRQLAFARLGTGAVVRAVDSSTITPIDVVDDVLSIAAANRIPATYGTTSGGTDATPFVAWGATPVPLSWPGRYSHSPAEVADLRDVTALASLVRALAARP